MKISNYKILNIYNRTFYLRRDNQDYKEKNANETKPHFDVTSGEWIVRSPHTLYILLTNDLTGSTKGCIPTHIRKTIVNKAIFEALTMVLRTGLFNSFCFNFKRNIESI